MRFEIQTMQEQHVCAVAEMEKLCFPVPWSEHSVRNELHNAYSRWLVAVCDGVVIGYIGAQIAADESDIMNVAIHPDFRRNGIATSLFCALEERLRGEGVCALLLEVRKSNTSAISLYGKMGFTTVGVRPNYYFSPREDALIMRKEL